MGTNIVGVSYFCLFFSFLQPAIANCAGWGTLEQAKELFITERIKIEEIHNILESHPRLTYVIPGVNTREYGPFDPAYQGWTQATYRAYDEIVRTLGEIEIQRVSMERFTDHYGSNVEYVNFVVFGRGLAGGSEAITITRVEGSRKDRRPDLTGDCERLEEFWFVCHTN